MENKPNQIIWHHTGVQSANRQADGVNTSHKKRGFPKSSLGFYGGYHVLIERDGGVVQFREDNEIGAHVKHHNINSLGIGMSGNFNVEKPSAAQAIAFIKVLADWSKAYGISPRKILPHRELSATDCPGTLMDDKWATALLRLGSTLSIRESLIDIFEYAIEKLNAPPR